MGLSFAGTNDCINNPDFQTRRSHELQTLLIEDQKDREKDWSELTPEEIEVITANDLNRRKRVGEIFGEGCITTDKDCLASFMIFQHGEIPDHYYQAFLFALRAGELKNKEGFSSAATAIDIYFAKDINNSSAPKLMQKILMVVSVLSLWSNHSLIQ